MHVLEGEHASLTASKGQHERREQAGGKGGGGGGGWEGERGHTPHHEMQ